MAYKILTTSLLLMLSVAALSLEIDEKLTLRVLKVSSSKKTILVNRGLEDGLAEGDHAKFFLTTGVVGRGVVVKASPSRSIWSVYRVVDAEKLIPDQVLNLKIATPVKLSPDKTRMINPEPSFAPNQDTSVVLPAGADSVNEDLSDTEDNSGELASLKNDDKEITEQLNLGTFRNKEYEVVTELGLSSLSMTNDGNGGSTKSNSLNIALAIEKYFSKSTGFLRNLSVLAIFNDDYSKSTQNVVSNGTTTTKDSNSNTMELGGGAHYHFLQEPFVYGKVIGYTGIHYGMGKVSQTPEDSTETVAGSTNFFEIPVGLKYYVNQGFGLRVSMNYISRSSTYKYTNITETEKLSGFVYHIGLSYRF